ncbi:hypothetical protein C0J52_22403 [Blattella germanica]|nr:hypothetical protein C0J52_22403 [Blattella germanica]
MNNSNSSTRRDDSIDGCDMMFSNQRKCLTEDEVLDILYNDDSGHDLIPELDSHSDSESDNEAYRTDIIHCTVFNAFILHKKRKRLTDMIVDFLAFMQNASKFGDLVPLNQTVLSTEVATP